MEAHKRKFAVACWLKHHGHTSTAWHDEEYRWVWGEAIYRYYLDTHKGEHVPLTKIEFCHQLGALDVRVRKKQWGQQYQVKASFDIPEGYISTVDEAVVEKKRIHNERRRKKD